MYEMVVKNQNSQYLSIMLKIKKKSYTIKEVLYKVFGEGNGNPLKYSCLENPRDRGA